MDSVLVSQWQYAPSTTRRGVSTKLFWVDLEMTGVDVERGHLLLEVAALVSDSDLNVLETYHRYVHREYTDLKILTPFARRTFSKARSDGTSLVHQCVTRGYPETTIDMELSIMMDRHRDGQTMQLCGSSIHTDRVFVKYFLPNTYARLHFQQIDVTTLLKLAQMWRPDLMSLPTAPRPTGGHCASGDVQDSLELLRFFRSTCYQRRPRIPPASNDLKLALYVCTFVVWILEQGLKLGQDAGRKGTERS